MKIPPRLLGCALLVASLATSVSRSQSVTEQAMAADAHPSFAVAVIKPSDPNSPIGESFESEGHHLQCRNATLIDIIAVVYGLQLRQIIGTESWLSKEKFDITGTPDLAGVPNTAQFREMYQKLLVDRFHLTLHRDTREMPIYALTVAKGGPRLKALIPRSQPMQVPPGASSAQ